MGLKVTLITLSIKIKSRSKNGWKVSGGTFLRRLVAWVPGCIICMEIILKCQISNGNESKSDEVPWFKFFAQGTFFFGLIVHFRSVNQQCCSTHNVVIVLPWIT
jgi:hypothetical protein